MLNQWYWVSSNFWGTILTLNGKFYSGTTRHPSASFWAWWAPRSVRIKMKSSMPWTHLGMRWGEQPWQLCENHTTISSQKDYNVRYYVLAKGWMINPGNTVIESGGILAHRATLLRLENGYEQVFLAEILHEIQNLCGTWFGSIIKSSILTLKKILTSTQSNILIICHHQNYDKTAHLNLIYITNLNFCFTTKLTFFFVRLGHLLGPNKPREREQAIRPKDQHTLGLAKKLIPA